MRPARAGGRHQVEAVQAPVPGEHQRRARPSAAGAGRRRARSASWRHTPASQTAWVPHSRQGHHLHLGPGARGPARPRGGRRRARWRACRARPTSCRPAPAGASRPRKAPGVAGVARGRQTRLNRAASGRAPSRARAWHSAPALTRQASGCGHSHRSPLDQPRRTPAPARRAAYRFMAIQKKHGGGGRAACARRRSRTPQASTTASTGGRRHDAASASSENSGRRTAPRRSPRVSSARAGSWSGGG